MPGEDPVAAQLALFDPDGAQQRAQDAPGLRLADGPDQAGKYVDAIEGYCEAKEVAHNTRLSFQTCRRRWLDWVGVHRSVTPMHVDSVTSADLREFLEWIYQEARGRGENAGNTHNKRRCELHAVFSWLAAEQKITSLPIFPAKRKKVRKEAGLYFLTDEESSRLYWACLRLTPPSGRADPRPFATLWQTALVLLRNYGFDTGVLFPWTKSHRSVLCWGDVYAPGLPPGREATIESRYGWLRVVRQKTNRLMLCPLEPIAAAHLEAIRPANADPKEPVLGKAGGPRPSRRFQRLCKLARLPAKIDKQTGKEIAWVVKDLRKTCSTWHNASREGSASAFLGHAGSGSMITEQHYINPLPAMVADIEALPQPEAFRSILDDSIKPPEWLFAK